MKQGDILRPGGCETVSGRSQDERVQPQGWPGPVLTEMDKSFMGEGAGERS